MRHSQRGHFTANGEQVARKRKYDTAFRRDAVRRLNDCASVTSLARELGIRRKWLYEWKKQFPELCPGAAGDEALGGGAEEGERPAPPHPPPEASPPDLGGAAEQRRLRQRIGDLERLVAHQALEIDFFRGALRRVNERRAASRPSGAAASTAKSGPERSSKAD